MHRNVSKASEASCILQMKKLKSKTLTSPSKIALLIDFDSGHRPRWQGPLNMFILPSPFSTSEPEALWLSHIYPHEMD